MPRALPATLLVALLALSACSQHDPAATARAFIAKGDYASAAVHLRTAVQAEPESAELRVLLADAQERRHDLPGAQENLTKALESGADPNLLVPRLALIMLDRNESDALVRAHHGDQLTDPGANASLRGTVALALLALNRPEEAVAQLQRAKAAAASVDLARAQLLVLDGKVKQGLESLRLDGAGAAAPWWMLRAAKRMASELKDGAQAVAYMKRAVDQVPWHGGVVGEYGEALVTAGRFDEAATVRNELRKQYPALFWVHYLDALLLHRAGRFEETHAAALRALRASPSHVPSTLMAASAELQKGDLLMAEKRLQGLLKKTTGNLTAWQLYAQLQGRLGNTPELTTAVQRGLKVAPRDALLLTLQADLQLAAGQVKPALATLQAILDARPQDIDALLKLANARAIAGDKPGALALVERAGTNAESDARVSARAVSAALELGNPALARKLADQAVARQPGDAAAQLALAAVQSAQNNGAGAWATTLAVLDKDPTQQGALSALAAMARKPEELAQMRDRHLAAVEAGSRNAQAYLDYAAMLMSIDPKQRKAEPQAVLERGLRALPTLVSLREALVEQLLRQGESDQAIATAQAGVSMANASPAAAALLANTYERLGKNQPAAEAWSKLVQNYPQRGDWRLRMAMAQLAVGQTAEAAKQLRALIDERPFDIQPYLALAPLQAKTDLSAALDTARQLGEQPGLKPAGLLLAGDLLAGAGRNDDALAQFDAASKAGAGANATWRTVQLLDRTGRAADAQRELDAALRKSPDDTTLVARAAQRAQAAGKADEAVSLLQRAAQREQRNPFLLNDLAWAQLTAGRVEALATARRAAALAPREPTVLHTLGMALSKAGKKEEAIEALRSSANLAPLAATPRLHLAQHLAAAGDKVGAAHALRTIDGASLPARDRDTLGKLKAELGIS